MENQDAVYHETCKKCRASVDIDAETLVAVVLRAKWHAPTIATIKNLRRMECGTWGTATRLTWLCPRCGRVHSTQVWKPDEFQQFPLDGLL